MPRFWRSRSPYHLYEKWLLKSNSLYMGVFIFLRCMGSNRNNILFFCLVTENKTIRLCPSVLKRIHNQRPFGENSHFFCMLLSLFVVFGFPWSWSFRLGMFHWFWKNKVLENKIDNSWYTGIQVLICVTWFHCEWASYLCKSVGTEYLSHRRFIQAFRKRARERSNYDSKSTRSGDRGRSTNKERRLSNNRKRDSLTRRGVCAVGSVNTKKPSSTTVPCQLQWLSLTRFAT